MDWFVKTTKKKNPHNFHYEDSSRYIRKITLNNIR